MLELRSLIVESTGAYTPETRFYDGREHIVVPVVALTEGVVHAVNAPQPELVKPSNYKHTVPAWNGRPIFEGHPRVNGEYVSGNSPEVLETHVGRIFDTKVDGNALKMNAWIDVERAKVHAPKLLERARAGEPIEISLGAFVKTKEVAGVWGGKRYAAEWVDLEPDHLALLVEGDEGACSRAAGCGVRAAQAQGADLTMYDEFRTLRDVPQEQRDKLDDSDFAGPNRSFPIGEPADVAAAAHALGRAKGDRNAIKRKIISIAYRKGDDFVAQLPDDWKKKSDQRNASVFARMMDAAQRFFRSSQNADEMSDNDLRCKLRDALKELEPAVQWVDGFFPVTDPTHVVYTVSEPIGEVYGEAPYEYPGIDYVQYERAFTLDTNGVVTIGKARVQVTPVTKYEPVEGAEPEVLSKPAAQNPEQGDPGSQNSDTPQPSTLSSQEKKPMTKCELKAFLENATDEQIATLSAAAEGKKVEAAPAAAATTQTEQPTVAAPAAAATTQTEQPTVAAAAPAAVKAPTFEELLAAADADTRAAITAAKAAAATLKGETIKALKATGRCNFSDEQLNGMDQNQLNTLKTLAGVQEVRSAVDFSGIGAAREASAAPEAIAAPPDLGAAIRAARGQK